MEEKRGEITSGTVITVTLLILGFAIILFFYWQLNWEGQIDNEVCHQSVIFRATLPSIAGVKEYIPLKCKTEKICITSGIFGGKCKEFENSKGVTKVRVKNLEQIERVIAQSILECWSTMGEGRISLFTQWIAENYGVGKVYPTCVICDRIAFDTESLEKSNIDLNEINVFEYMLTHAVPGKEISYYDYLAGDSPAKLSIDESIFEKGITFDDVISEKEKGDYDEEKDQELAVLFMQISAPSHGKSARNIGYLAFGTATASFATSAGGTVAAGKSVGNLCTSGGWIGPVVCGSILAVAAIYQQGSVAYNRAVTAGYCGDVSVSSDARNGCSVVRTVNYDEEGIKQYCEAIESIP